MEQQSAGAERCSGAALPAWSVSQAPGPSSDGEKCSNLPVPADGVHVQTPAASGGIWVSPTLGSETKDSVPGTGTVPGERSLEVR